MKRIFVVLSMPVLALIAPGLAQEATPMPEESPPEVKAPPEPESYVTTGEVRIDGKAVRYQATAGTLILENAEEKPIARFGYIAYVRQGGGNAAQRPITFAYNGGPGSSSIWLHMGILGPRRAVANDVEATPPPYGVTDNAYSVLDRTDIVMIDPVGTGLSRPLDGAKGELFWGVDKDAESIGNFINRYVTESGRWRSPKYLLGESYGAMRSAVLVHHMQTRYNMAFAGVVLVSPFLDFTSGVDGVGADLPHVLYLPTLAATAWHHDALDDKPADLITFLEEVERFATDEYAPALLKGARLTDAERAAVRGKLAQYTGLSESYLDRADLRVSHTQFTQELLRERGITVGRIDARFSGPSLNPLAERMPYDPFMSDVGAPFTAAFKDYFHGELQVPRDRDYRVSAFELWKSWDWSHRRPDLTEFHPPAPDTAPDLAHAMNRNPNLRLLVQQGYFDLATPHFVTEYVLDHMRLQPDARRRIQVEYYDSGHMMYLHPPSMSKFRDDLVRFIDEG